MADLLVRGVDEEIVQALEDANPLISLDRIIPKVGSSPVKL